MKNIWGGDDILTPLLLVDYIWERQFEEEVVSGDPTSFAMADLNAELWLVRWNQNKDGGHNETNKHLNTNYFL